jgi:hypothetical protein
VDGYLAADLQKVVRDSGSKVTAEITPWVKEFFAAQEKIYVANGGKVSKLPDDEFKAMIAKVSTIGDDLSKTKPALNEAVKALFESAAQQSSVPPAAQRRAAGRRRATKGLNRGRANDRSTSARRARAGVRAPRAGGRAAGRSVL